MGQAAKNDTDRIGSLEAQISDLEDQLGQVRRQLSEAELDQWRARIDDLEVQAHLGSLEVKDELDPLIADLRDSWLNARARVTSGASTASEVVDAVRGGLEQAMGDIRRSLLEARSAVQHK